MVQAGGCGDVTEIAERKRVHRRTGSTGVPCEAHKWEYFSRPGGGANCSRPGGGCSKTRGARLRMASVRFHPSAVLESSAEHAAGFGFHFLEAASFTTPCTTEDFASVTRIRHGFVTFTHKKRARPCCFKILSTFLKVSRRGEFSMNE